ncbi:MAG: methyltransferase [Ruminococcus sp.]|jgi:16S rRNA (guanine1207-N2)-methyltransferase|nr:methyltransferase [Ruminococcus sp.]
MIHYFTDEKPSGVEKLSGSESTFTLRYRGNELKFTSGAGVFSHGEADRQSMLLIGNIPLAADESFLDLGCGYGLIGITLAKVTGCKVTMSDITEKAVKFAERNAAQNGVKARIVKSDGFENIAEAFNKIALNPPVHAGKEVCYRLYAEAALHLNADGKFYIVIADKHGAQSHIKKLNEFFDVVKITARKDGVNVIECDKTKGGQI